MSIRDGHIFDVGRLVIRLDYRSKGTLDSCCNGNALALHIQYCKLGRLHGSHIGYVTGIKIWHEVLYEAQNKINKNLLIDGGRLRQS